MQKNFQDKVILTIDDLAAYTGWSKSYIYKKTSDGTLKFSKPLGKTIFFSKEWVDKFLMGAEYKTAAETKRQAANYVTLKTAAK